MLTNIEEIVDKYNRTNVLEIQNREKHFHDQ